MIWKRLIERNSPEESEIEKKLDTMMNFFHNYEYDINKFGVMSGNSGIILFLFYYDKYKNTNNNTTLIERIIEKTLRYTNKNMDLDFTFCNGICGLLWTIHHINQDGLFDFSIDEHTLIALQSCMNRLLRDNILDYLYGASGFCLLFISLFHQYGITSNAIQDYVHYCFNKLKADSKSRSLFYNGHSYNFGLPHGFPAILILISKIKNFKITNENETDLILARGMGLLESYIQNPSESGSYYPTHVNINDITPGFSKLSWCYGDLSCSIAKLHLANILRKESHFEKIKEILFFSAKRNSYESNKIVEPCLCHGASGNAHIFNRFHQYFDNDPILKDAALNWYNYTMGLLSKDSYFLNQPLTGNVKGNEFNLLVGIAGIGLSLLSALGVYPAWDEVFFLNFDKT